MYNVDILEFVEPVEMKKIGIVSQNPQECAEITSRPHPEHFVPFFFK